MVVYHIQIDNDIKHFYEIKIDFDTTILALYHTGLSWCYNWYGHQNCFCDHIIDVYDNSMFYFTWQCMKISQWF